MDGGYLLVGNDTSASVSERTIVHWGMKCDSQNASYRVKNQPHPICTSAHIQYAPVPTSNMHQCPHPICTSAHIQYAPVPTSNMHQCPHPICTSAHIRYAPVPTSDMHQCPHPICTSAHIKGEQTNKDRSSGTIKILSLFFISLYMC